MTSTSTPAKVRDAEPDLVARRRRLRAALRLEDGREVAVAERADDLRVERDAAPHERAAPPAHAVPVRSGDARGRGRDEKTPARYRSSRSGAASSSSPPPKPSRAADSSA